MVTVFHSIDNFRDLADSVQRRSRICSRSIFRSATLDYASEDELDKLVEELNVNTILDLRSELEAQLSKLGKPFASFPIATAMKLKPTDLMDPDPEPSVHEKTDGPTRKTIMINFAGKKFRKYAVWKAAPLKVKMQIVGLMAAGQKPKAVKLVGEEIIARKGLAGLYRDFVDYCDQEICEALQVLADPSNYPILVHCTQGKDRTGLVTALALAAAGIEEEKIIEDYAKSQQGLARVRTHMVAEMERDGLDPSFADAPPEVMQRTFDYIREKYTNVDGYLDYIGFDNKERETLKQALVFKKMQMDLAYSPQPKTGNDHAESSTSKNYEENAEKDSSDATDGAQPRSRAGSSASLVERPEKEKKSHSNSGSSGGIESSLPPGFVGGIGSIIGESIDSLVGGLGHTIVPMGTGWRRHSAADMSSTGFTKTPKSKKENKEHKSKSSHNSSKSHHHRRRSTSVDAREKKAQQQAQ